MRHFFTATIQSLMVSSLLLSANSPFACTNPMDAWSTGVLFNNNEPIRPDRFDSIGTEGKDFFRKCITIKPLPTPRDIIMVPELVKIDIELDPFTINSVSLINNILSFVVRYGGGCAPHDFNLYSMPSKYDPMPPLNDFTLSHNANNDLCKALITDTISFNLVPFEQVYARQAPIQIMVTGSDTGKRNSSSHILWYPNNTCSYTWRSHYESISMVHLDFYHAGGLHYFPRLAFVADSNVARFAPINYAFAIKKELEWLVQNRILYHFDTDDIEKVYAATLKQQGQYWTRQDTILPYNGEFVYRLDTASAFWKWTDAVLVRKGCGLDIPFSLPPSALGGVGVAEPGRIAGKRTLLSAIKTIPGGLVVHFTNPVADPGKISIYNQSGRVLCQKPIAAGSQQATMSFSGNRAYGLFIVKVTSKNISEKRSILFN